MMISIGKSEYDPIKRELVGSKKKRKLRPGIHKLMMCLLPKCNEIVPKEELMAAISGTENQLRVYVSRLRSVLAIVDEKLTIENKYRNGYTLKVN